MSASAFLDEREGERGHGVPQRLLRAFDRRGRLGRHGLPGSFLDERRDEKLRKWRRRERLLAESDVQLRIDTGRLVFSIVDEPDYRDYLTKQPPTSVVHGR